MTCKKYFAKKGSNGFPVPGTMMGYDKDMSCHCDMVQILPKVPPIADNQYRSYDPAGFRYFVRVDCSGNIIPNSLFRTKDRPSGSVVEFIRVLNK